MENLLKRNKLAVGLIAGSVVILIVVLVMKKRENFSNLTEEKIQSNNDDKINKFRIDNKSDDRIKYLKNLRQNVDIGIEKTHLYYKIITNKESKIIDFLRFINKDFCDEALMEAREKNINSYEKAKVYEKITEDIKELLKKINEIINSSIEEQKKKQKLDSLDALYTPNPENEYNTLLLGAKKEIFSIIMGNISAVVDNHIPKPPPTVSSSSSATPIISATPVVEPTPNLVMNSDKSSNPNRTKITDFEEGVTTSALANNSQPVINTQPVINSQPAVVIQQPNGSIIYNGKIYKLDETQKQVVM